MPLRRVVQEPDLAARTANNCSTAGWEVRVAVSSFISSLQGSSTAMKCGPGRTARCRGSDVHIVAPVEFTDLLDVLDPEPGSRGQRRGPVCPGHADERDAGHLGEVLECEQPESAAADHAQSNGVVVHGFQSCGCKYAQRKVRRAAERLSHQPL